MILFFKDQKEQTVSLNIISVVLKEQLETSVTRAHLVTTGSQPVTRVTAVRQAPLALSVMSLVPVNARYLFLNLKMFFVLFCLEKFV